MVIRRRMAAIVTALTLVGGGLVAMAGPGPRDGATTTKVAPGSKGHGKMVFVLTTGLEDLQSVNMAIRHSGMAKKSGFLDDSVLLVYGRAVQAFSKDNPYSPAAARCARSGPCLRIA